MICLFMFVDIAIARRGTFLAVALQQQQFFHTTRVKRILGTRKKLGTSLHRFTALLPLIRYNLLILGMHIFRFLVSLQ